MASAMDSGVETSSSDDTSSNSDDTSSSSDDTSSSWFIQYIQENSQFLPVISEEEKRSLTSHSDLSVTRDQSNNTHYLLLNAQHKLEVVPSSSKLPAKNDFKRRWSSFSILPKERKIKALRGYSLLECHHHIDTNLLKFAIETNNIKMAEKHLSSGISANGLNSFGQTYLHTASSGGYSEIVSLLLTYGADPNSTDSKSNTPLHLAASSTKIKVVSLLLKAGANPLRKNISGDTPLRTAQMNLSLISSKHSDSDELHNRKFKEEVENIVNMLVAVLQKKKDADADKQIENLTELCSQLSLSNTSDELKEKVGTVLAESLNAMSI